MIVESPAKAKTIEKYLGKDFIVRASFGHVRDLSKDNHAIDVENNFAPQYEILPDKLKVIKELKELIAKTEVVWLATDEDREGEAISWHLAVALGLNIHTTNRVVFNEITKNAITKAVQNPRKIDLQLVDAQQARRVLDRLVGFKLSPVLWSKIKSGLSAGRVQSVAVRLIVEREKEIDAFQANSSFKITADFLTDKKESVKAELVRKCEKKDEANAFLQSCIGATYKVTKLETRPAKKSPAPPFTTSTLQQEASRKLSFSVKKTMMVAQRLYEAGHITYMRTDSVNLSQAALQQAEQVVTGTFGQQYHQLRNFKNKNTSAQEAHEAIRPTDFSVSKIMGENDENRLYELIWKRALASQMADAQLERTVADIIASTNQELFQAVGEVIKFDGFLKLYRESFDEEEEEEGKNMLPLMKVGQILDLKEMVALERYTRPNPRYTEAALVKKLEELGIGRPSTYAPTISTVQDRGYVVKENREGVKRDLNVLTLKDSKITPSIKTEMTGAEKNKLFPTDLGKPVTAFLMEHFEQIMDYSFTAKVEGEFDEIAKTGKKWQQMISEFYTPFSKTIEKVSKETARVSVARLIGTHPETGKNVYAKLGKFGPMIQLGENDDDDKKFTSLGKGQSLDTVSLEEALKLLKNPPFCIHEKTQKPIYIKKGPYGNYLQLGDNDDPEKANGKITKGFSAETMTPEEANRIFDLPRLPRELGTYKGMSVAANDGFYGAYVKVGDKNVTLPPKTDNVYTVTLERAIELYELKLISDENKIKKKFAENANVLIQIGKYNKPYLKWEADNVPLPKDFNIETATFADVTALHEEWLKLNPPKPQKKAVVKKADATKTDKKTPSKKGETPKEEEKPIEKKAPSIYPKKLAPKK